MGVQMTPFSAGNIGLRTRILLIAFAIVITATSGAIATSSYLFIERLTQAQQSRAEAIAKGLYTDLQRLFSLGIRLNQLHGFEDQCREAVENNDGLSKAMVITPDGQILFHNEPAQMAGNRISDAMADAIAKQQHLFKDENTSTYFALLPIIDSSGANEGTIAVGFPFSLVVSQRNQLIGNSMIVSLIAIGAGMLLMLFILSRYVIRPISNLVAATEGLRTTDDTPPGERLPESNLFEFGVMARGVNRLLDRIEAHELALKQAKDMAITANRAKNAFLANMSHELRTPMNAIMGYTDLASHKTREQQTRKYLEQMRIAEQNLLVIIDDVLDLSRIEAERLSLELKPMSIKAVIDSQLALIARAAEAKQLSIYTEIASELAVQKFLGDAQRLGQVLLNLFGNAVKFTENGSITVIAHVVNGSNSKGTEIQFEVQDTGIGISPDDYSRLFQPFEQADNSSTRKFGGTGLGLAISKRLVELMNGRIGVDSQLGKGSTFWFTVVLDKPSTMQTEQSGEEPVCFLKDAIQERFSGTGVLVVEDDEVNQMVISELLVDAGLKVDVANDGQEALNKVDPARHAIILMDVHMPKMDGISTTIAMRQQPTLRGVPIVALTANAFDENRQRCLDAGMDDFIAKPVEPAVIYRTIRSLLDRKAA